MINIINILYIIYSAYFLNIEDDSYNYFKVYFYVKINQIHIYIKKNINCF